LLFPATFSLWFSWFHTAFSGSGFVLVAYTWASVVNLLWVFPDGAFTRTTVRTERVGTGEWPEFKLRSHYAIAMVNDYLPPLGDAPELDIGG
jgi:hypothetical protein